MVPKIIVDSFPVRSPKTLMFIMQGQYLKQITPCNICAARDQSEWSDSYKVSEDLASRRLKKRGRGLERAQADGKSTSSFSGFSEAQTTIALSPSLGSITSVSFFISLLHYIKKLKYRCLRVKACLLLFEAVLTLH